MYLVFKENIQIATLLKRGNKNVDIKFSAHERFWNNLHQVAQDQKIGKPNNLIVLGAQDLWVLMLCRSFFTPGRDIGSAVFMVWVLVQSGMLSCDSTVNTGWHTLYVTARNKFENNIQLINISFVLNVLLYDDEGESYETNNLVFQQVQLFIKETGRFIN